jgi:hypothetical protein
MPFPFKKRRYAIDNFGFVSSNEDAVEALRARGEREQDRAARERERERRNLQQRREEATAGVMPKLDKAASLSGASGIGEHTRDPSLFRPSESEVNLYQLHVEDLLSLNPNAEEDPTVTDLDNKLLLYGFFSSPSSSVLASFLPLSDCFRDVFSAVFLLRVGIPM